MVFAKLFGNLAELLKRDFVVVVQYRDNAKPDDILERIHPAERAASVVGSVVRREKFGIVPIRKLTK